MAKSFMQVTALVPTTRMHDLDAALEDCDGMQVMWRPYRNGHATARPKREGNIKATSAAQQAWIAKHITKQMTLPEIRGEWAKTEFRVAGLFGALAKALREGTIKKVEAGVYKPGRKAS